MNACERRPARKWNGPWRTPRSRPSRSRRGLPALLTVALLSGCATVPMPSYRVQIPVLTMRPLVGTCQLQSGGQTRCLTLSEKDYRAIVVELKAACLANQQPPEECETATLGVGP